MSNVVTKWIDEFNNFGRGCSSDEILSILKRPRNMRSPFVLHGKPLVNITREVIRSWWTTGLTCEQGVIS